MNSVIRPVTHVDADRYQELIVAAYQASAKAGVHFAAEHADAAMIQNHLNGNAAYVLEEYGRFVSTISLRFPWGPNPGPFGIPHIGWFATHPDFAKQGKAKILLDWLEKNVLSAQLHLPAVSLGTAKEHPWLQQMYDGLGFERVRETDLGLGHITVYFIKVLNRNLFDAWASKHLKELKK